MLSTCSALPAFPIATLVDRIFAFRQITRLDQYLLNSSLEQKASLGERERSMLQQVYHALENGAIAVAD
ncbi:MAG: hypothetical protein HC925_02160 [Coleofasciculaceae cyanobacterium SM2_3_26]|nr:hypothetical protein [Coleofasciculaceae cyanobacterium SM2_3_26]